MTCLDFELRSQKVGSIGERQGHTIEETRTYLANVVQVFEDGLVDFHEDNLLVDAGWEAAFVRVLLLAGFDDDDCFGSLDLSW